MMIPDVNTLSEYESAFDAQWTLSLHQHPSTLDKIGGKAFGLQRLIAHSLPVPQGFCIVTDVFDRMVSLALRSSKSIEELQRALLEVPFPHGFEEEVRQQMEQIGASSWAVRSSAVEEDHQEHSFAGQQATLLRVQGTEAVLHAIRQVWTSLYNIESLLYRTQMNIELVPGSIAVLVQEMLEPIAAGVMFTMNPVAKDEQEIVVSAARGLSEDVVSGKKSETYYLEKVSGYIRRQTRDEESSEDKNDSAGTPILHSQDLAHLSQIAREVESIFERPQDVEWAYVQKGSRKKELFFLQSRPIFQSVPTKIKSEIWTNTNVGEALPGVGTPLTWSIIRQFGRKGFERAFGTLGLKVPENYELVRSFQGRVYLNLTQFMSIASAVPYLKPETLFAMAGGGGLHWIKENYEKRSSVEFVARLPLTLYKIGAAQLSLPFLVPAWGKYFDTKCEEFFEVDLSQQSFEQLRQELKHINRLFDRNGLIMLTASSNFLMSYVVLREILYWWGGADAAQHERNLFGGMEVKSAKPGFALLELGRIARRSRRLRKLIQETPTEQAWAVLHEQKDEHQDVADFIDAMNQFCETYGHRAPREAELATPRWREDRSFLFEVMRSFVQAPYLPSMLEVEREKRKAWRATQQMINTTFQPGVRGVFRSLLSFTRLNAQLREIMRDRVVDALDMYRQFFLECGHRLVASEYLSDAEDVFFLRFDEIQEWLNRPEKASSFNLRVLVRKAIFDAFKQLPDPPNTFLLRGNEIVPEEDMVHRLDDAANMHRRMADQTYKEIFGLPGSSGRVTGRARVILDPHQEEATIEPGEILVAPYTDVGWTPLFLSASAVVVALGGPLSHACIVAREYGIPMVVNAKHAIELIQTGDIITVDGNHGVVYVKTKDH